jgi:hypothetical protein
MTRKVSIDNKSLPDRVECAVAPKNSGQVLKQLLQLMESNKMDRICLIGHERSNRPAILIVALTSPAAIHDILPILQAGCRDLQQSGNGVVHCQSSTALRNAVEWLVDEGEDWLTAARSPKLERVLSLTIVVGPGVDRQLPKLLHRAGCLTSEMNSAGSPSSHPRE